MTAERTENVERTENTTRTDPTWMQTYTGRMVRHPLRAEDIDPRDLAHSLACTNRYNGHSRHPFSVAQHSVLLARWIRGEAIRKTDWDDVVEGRVLLDPHPALALSRAALLHDASEAYLCDIPRPYKRLLGPVYAELEAGAMRAVEARFGLAEGITSSPEIVTVDWRILSDEKAVLHRKPPAEWTLHADGPLGVFIEEWSWRGAEEEFLRELRFLFPEIMEDVESGPDLPEYTR